MVATTNFRVMDIVASFHLVYVPGVVSSGVSGGSWLSVLVVGYVASHWGICHPMRCDTELVPRWAAIILQCPDGIPSHLDMVM